MTEGLIALVKTKTAITDLIGTDPLRMFPVFLPQGISTFPAIAYRELPLRPTNTFDGGSKYDFHFLDVFFYDRKYIDVKTLFDTFRTEIEDTVAVHGGVDIKHIWFEGSGMEDYLEDLRLWTKHGEYKIAVTR